MLSQKQRPALSGVSPVWWEATVTFAGKPVRYFHVYEQRAQLPTEARHVALYQGIGCSPSGCISAAPTTMVL